MWCVLVSDPRLQRPGDMVTVGSYRSEAKASAVADQINRKIEIHSPAMAWPSLEPGELNAWVTEMRSKVTEVYDALGIRSLR